MGPAALTVRARFQVPWQRDIRGRIQASSFCPKTLPQSWHACVSSRTNDRINNPRSAGEGLFG